MKYSWGRVKQVGAMMACHDQCIYGGWSLHNDAIADIQDTAVPVAQMYKKNRHAEYMKCA
jgi:hypothetical protein